MYITETINDASPARFVSDLQPSNAPTIAAVLDAIDERLRCLGPQQCRSAIAEEFGDHPQKAIHRMRRPHRMAARAFGRPDLQMDLRAPAQPGTEPTDG